MYSLRIGCFIGALFTSFGIYAQCDEKAKNAGSTGFSNEVVEKIAEKNCSVDSDYHTIRYHSTSLVEVETCFGGEDNGDRHIVIHSPAYELCIFPVANAAEWTRYNFDYKAVEIGEERFQTTDYDLLCGRSGHKIFLEASEYSSHLLIMDSGVAHKFLHCLDEVMDGENDRGKIYRDVTTSCDKLNQYANQRYELTSKHL